MALPLFFLDDFYFKTTRIIKLEVDGVGLCTGATNTWCKTRLTAQRSFETKIATRNMLYQTQSTFLFSHGAVATCCSYGITSYNKGQKFGLLHPLKKNGGRNH